MGLEDTIGAYVAPQVRPVGTAREYLELVIAKSQNPNLVWSDIVSTHLLPKDQDSEPEPLDDISPVLPSTLDFNKYAINKISLKDILRFGAKGFAHGFYSAFAIARGINKYEDISQEIDTLFPILIDFPEVVDVPPFPSRSIFRNVGNNLLINLFGTAFSISMLSSFIGSTLLAGSAGLKVPFAVAWVLSNRVTYQSLSDETRTKFEINKSNDSVFICDPRYLDEPNLSETHLFDYDPNAVGLFIYDAKHRTGVTLQFDRDIGDDLFDGISDYLEANPNINRKFIPKNITEFLQMYKNPLLYGAFQSAGILRRSDLFDTHFFVYGDEPNVNSLKNAIDRYTSHKAQTISANDNFNQVVLRG